MASIELLEEEEIAIKYAKENHRGNISEFVRIAIKEYDKNKRVKQNTIMFQTISYLLISICFLLLAINFITPLFIVVLPAIFILSSVFIVVYVYIIFRGRNKVKGGVVWE